MELEDLIAPISQEEFFARFWENDVLHISRDDAKYFPFLNGDSSLEKTIQLFCREWGDVSLARADIKQEDCPYIGAAPDLRTITKAFQERYTVVVNDLQLKDLAVADLCRSIERSFLCRANVNAYLTNFESQGLKAHYDDDDVFILQLRGRKSWKIYGERVDLPLAEMRYRELSDDNPVYEEYSLSPGDVFYIPRGVFHEAQTDATVSLHLTVSMNTVRWAELLKELVQLRAEDEAKLRRSVHPRLLQGTAGVEESASAAQSLWNSAFDANAIQRAAHRLQDRILSGMVRLATVPFVPTVVTEKLDQDTRLRIAPDQMCCMEQTAGGCRIKSIGAEFEFPSSMAELVRFLCSTGQFSPREFPGNLSAAARLELAQQFLKNGLVVVVK